VLVGMSVGFSSMLEWSLGEGRTRVPVPPEKRWAARARFMSGGLVYLVIVAIAFVNAVVALSLSGLVALYYIFESTPTLGKPEEPSEPGD